jgi:hypothetical protein
MSVEWKGNPEMLPNLRLAVTRGLNAYLLVLGRAMRAQLSKAGTGRLYARRSAYRRAMRKAKTVEAVEKIQKRYEGKNLRQRGYHRASAAGNPPTVDTGALRRSWQIGSDAAVTPYSTTSTLGMRYGSRLKYALIDRGMGRVKARPYIAPTIAAVSDLFEPTMARAVKAWAGGK